MNMEKIEFSRNRLKDYLSERLTHGILQMSENEIFEKVRHGGLGGYDSIGDEKLIDELVQQIPEYKLMQFDSADDKSIYLSVKPEHAKNEEEILVDIIRIRQMKFLV
jgi:hypothetical protein